MSQEIEMTMQSDRSFQGTAISLQSLAIYNYANGEVGDNVDVKFQLNVPFAEAAAQIPVPPIQQTEPTTAPDAAVHGESGPSSKIAKTITQQRFARPGMASSSTDETCFPPPVGPPPPTLAVALRDVKAAEGGANHLCSICQRPFVQSKLLICQADPSHDVDGQLYKLCFDSL